MDHAKAVDVVERVVWTRQPLLSIGNLEFALLAKYRETLLGHRDGVRRQVDPGVAGTSAGEFEAIGGDAAADLEDVFSAEFVKSRDSRHVPFATFVAVAPYLIEIGAS